MSEEQKLSPEESLAFYTSLPERLVTAVSKLSDAELDLTGGPDEWSIRQIVHHLADGQTIWTVCMRLAIGVPSAAMQLDWYPGNDAWSERMAFAKRGIEPSLALIRAFHDEIAELREAVDLTIERAPSPPDSDTDAQGRPALGRDYPIEPFIFIKPLSDPWGGTQLLSGRHPTKMVEPAPADDAPEHVVHLILQMCTSMPAVTSGWSRLTPAEADSSAAPTARSMSGESKGRRGWPVVRRARTANLRSVTAGVKNSVA